jgi:hypothetical protein
MSRWDPKLPLDASEWSLLPNIGLTNKSAMLAQCGWLAVSVGLYLLNDGLPIWVVVLSWLMGAAALKYITNRLSGRGAIATAGGDVVDSESPFQMRLLGDLTYVGLFGAMVVMKIIGRV